MLTNFIKNIWGVYKKKMGGRNKGKRAGGELFLRDECQLKIVNGMIEFLKSPFCNSLVIIDS